MNYIHHISWSPILLACGVALASMLTASPGHASENGAESIEEVVVTARRREEAAQDMRG